MATHKKLWTLLCGLLLSSGQSYTMNLDSSLKDAVRRSDAGQLARVIEQNKKSSQLISDEVLSRCLKGTFSQNDSDLFTLLLGAVNQVDLLTDFFFEAASKGKVRLMESLVTKFTTLTRSALSNPLNQVRNGLTALHYAAATGNAEIMRLLIDSGAEVNAYSAFSLSSNAYAKCSPLHCACYYGRKKCVEELLLSGARIGLWAKVSCLSIPTLGLSFIKVPGDVIFELNELHLAIQMGHAHCLALLLRKIEGIDYGFGNVVNKVSNDLYSRLLNIGRLVDQVATNCGTPLHQAILHGHSECLKLLLKAKADVDKVDKPDYGCTPLQYATELGSEKSVRELVESGADIFKKTSTGMTAAMLALAHGHKKIYEQLLKKGSSISDEEKKQSLETALKKGYLEGVDLCYSIGMPFNKIFFKGKTLLHLAKSTAVEKMLSYGVDLEGCGDIGLTPLKLAALEATISTESVQNSEEASKVLVLLNMGAKLYDSHNRSPLEALFSSGVPRVRTLCGDFSYLGDSFNPFLGIVSLASELVCRGAVDLFLLPDRNEILENAAGLGNRFLFTNLIFTEALERFARNNRLSSLMRTVSLLISMRSMDLPLYVIADHLFLNVDFLCDDILALLYHHVKSRCYSKNLFGALEKLALNKVIFNNSTFNEENERKMLNTFFKIVSNHTLTSEKEFFIARIIHEIRALLENIVSDATLEKFSQTIFSLKRYNRAGPAYRNAFKVDDIMDPQKVEANFQDHISMMLGHWHTFLSMTSEHSIAQMAPQ